MFDGLGHRHQLPTIVTLTRRWTAGFMGQPKGLALPHSGKTRILDEYGYLKTYPEGILAGHDPGLLVPRGP